MKDKFYLKFSNLESIFFERAAYITIVIGIMIVLGESKKLLPYAISAFVVLTVLLWCLEKNFRESGFYIDGENVYYKNFRTNNIDMTKVVAIKITHETIENRYGNKRLYKNGTPQFTATLLSSTDPKMYDPYLYDSHFFSRFNKCCICTFVYDKEAIDYLCTLNPDIVVIPWVTADG